MIVGVLTADLALYESRTLKDKRRVMLSLRDRLRNEFNVSVSEVGHGDSPKRCLLGVAIVSNGSRGAQSQLDRIVDVIRASAGVTLLDYERELL